MGHNGMFTSLVVAEISTDDGVVRGRQCGWKGLEA